MGLDCEGGSGRSVALTWPGKAARPHQTVQRQRTNRSACGFRCSRLWALGVGGVRCFGCAGGPGMRLDPLAVCIIVAPLCRCAAASCRLNARPLHVIECRRVRPCGHVGIGFRWPPHSWRLVHGVPATVLKQGSEKAGPTYGLSGGPDMKWACVGARVSAAVGVLFGGPARLWSTALLFSICCVVRGTMYIYIYMSFTMATQKG